ncbi:hypothetical protein HYC85_007119 [Camellia sinensis]|uniref:Phosducin thioredoxin-like domain-containing protein n=1 Tax=Camellia sinensis TaxID=4442 RepID=A0A7J7HN29_CAMSI|nr:hypothetical protein HYC85_007119 [Camellia sinensis]
MANYHFVYKDVEGASTQWDDIQKKLGNLPPKPPTFKPPSFKAAKDEDSKHKDKAWIDDRAEEQPQDLEDDLELDKNRFLQEYRKKRLGELRQAAKVQRYGSVVPISGSDFLREVSQAPPNVWVILATKYPATKFVKMISTDCIPNYPDCNLPTLLLYNNGVVKANYVGLHNFGRRCTPEVIMSLYVDIVSSKIPKDVEDVKSAPVMESSRPCKDVELSPSKDVEPRLFIDEEDPKLKLGKDIEELKSKLNIVALKNENSELSKKLDVALGKIEAIVIGCDGIRSPITKWIGFSEPKYASHYALCRLAFYLDGQPYEPKVNYIYGKEVRGGCVLVSPTKVYRFVCFNSLAPGII